MPDLETPVQIGRLRRRDRRPTDPRPPPAARPELYTLPDDCTLGGDSAAPHRAMPDRFLLTVLAGDPLGKVLRLDEGDVLIGRSDAAEVRLGDPGVSWRHARVARRNGVVYIQDLGSTNGTFVAGQRLEEITRLEHGDRICLGGRTVIRFSVVDELEEATAMQLYHSAVHDGLTGACNRRYLEQRLSTEVSYAARHGDPLAVLLIDIDHFKKVNDVFGHAIGDTALRMIAAAIQRMIRPGDMLARFGGEEFVVVARRATAEAAASLAERIRERVATLGLPSGEETQNSLSVSIGVAAVHASVLPDATALLSLADEAMYEAKQAGRNRVVLR